MLDGPTVVAAIAKAGFTHVVWVPDSHLGTWDAAFEKSTVVLVRPTREGEAIALAAGLMIGGAKPLVVVQCTGFFEAGDAVRNVVHDLGLPLKLLVGVRSWQAFQAGQSHDNCPRFAEPLVKAWDLPATWFDPFHQTAAECGDTLLSLAGATAATALLWME